MTVRSDGTRPTLEQVAALAGVSTATVSRVLNHSQRVSASARASVEGAVAQLGYVPNPAARSLVRRRTDTIALVISEPDERMFADPFLPAIVHGLGEPQGPDHARAGRARESPERLRLRPGDGEHRAVDR